MLKFGQKLKELRISKGLTQKDIEEKTGILQATLSSYENSRIEPNFDTLEKLANMLQIEIAEFFPPQKTSSTIGPSNPTDDLLPLNKEEREIIMAYRETEHPNDRRIIRDILKSYRRTYEKVREKRDKKQKKKGLFG